MLTTPILQSLAQVFTERMVNGMVQGVVLAAVAWIVLRMVGRESSSTRFAVWFVALLGTVALPLLQSVFLRQPVVPAADGVVERSAIVIPSSWALYLFCGWALVVVALLGRVVLGLWQIRGLRANCTRIAPASLDPVLLRALAESCARPVALYASSSLQTPMATGFFHPMIVLPEWALRELSVDELKVVLLHEAAHLHRWDDWTNLAQKVLRSLFFFHPVVWWIEGRLSLEREMACDDMVVARTASPRAYAACLVALAEKRLGRRSLAFAQAAVNRIRHTTLRVRRILDIGPMNATGVWKPAVGLVLASAVACFVSAPAAPRLVGFRSESGSIAASLASAQTSFPARVRDPLLHRVAFSTAPTRPSAKPQARGAVESAHRSLNPPLRLPLRRPAPEPVAQQESAASTVSPMPKPEWAGIPYQNVSFTTAGTASETFFVVTQDQQQNPAGDQVVRINVYRLTVFYPVFYPANPQKTLNKSI